MNGGIVFIDKEAGMTSRKVDNILGRLFHTRKVGHLGTLDPFATGLLIVGVNNGNKALRFALDEEKEYEAVLVLGKKTSTGDPTGEIIESQEIPTLDEDKVREAVSALVNEKSQIPPMTSAIKINGQALYELAHKGQEIEREPRPIAIYKSELLWFKDDKVAFRVLVSKGTYIRTLGETLAERLGTVGHLESLRRTKIGPFDVENAAKVGDIDESKLVDPLVVLDHMEQIEVDEATLIKVNNGVKLNLGLNHGDLVLLTHKNEAIAVYEKDGNIYACLRGLR